MPNTCGAKTRSGTPCANTAIMLNGRCRMHGGTGKGAPANNSNALTHGIYQQHLTPIEIAQFNALELGTVDQELRLTRIRLARALAAENASGGNPEIDNVTENDGGGVAVPREVRVSKTRDYVRIIDTLTARIESLEKTRLALGSTADPDEMNADGLTRGKPDEDGPPQPVR